MRSAIANVMFDFVDALESIDSEEGVYQQLNRITAFFGFTTFAVSGIPEPHEQIEPYILMNGWSAEWSQRYTSRDYVRIDPVIQRTLLSDSVFVWSEELQNINVDRKGIAFMREASDYGFVNGFSVPIHSIRGFRAIVTYSSDRVDLSREARGALHMISVYAHNKLKELKTGGKAPLLQRSVNLTPRERECISWCSEGKTAWEISTILGISERTVSHILENAQRKMNTTNRTQLVAESIRAGLIR